MKKFLLCLSLIIILTGCGNMNIGNTPSRKVEDYFNRYQTLDKGVMEDLTRTINNDDSINDDEKEDYIDFMKKHYQDLTYEIKDEEINGDDAIVTVEITVRDYSNVVLDAENYKDENREKFEEPELLSFSTYRLEELKKAKDTVTYTLNVTLIKQDDTWVVQQLSNEDLNKINGLYSS